MIFRTPARSHPGPGFHEGESCLEAVIALETLPTRIETDATSSIVNVAIPSAMERLDELSADRFQENDEGQP
jgi:hypothetical protein